VARSGAVGALQQLTWSVGVRLEQLGPQHAGVEQAMIEGTLTLSGSSSVMMKMAKNRTNRNYSYSMYQASNVARAGREDLVKPRHAAALALVGSYLYRSTLAATQNTFASFPTYPYGTRGQAADQRRIQSTIPKHPTENRLTPGVCSRYRWKTSCHRHSKCKCRLF
jgi:hypothetical protein